jgi:hypothetical protein
MRVDEHVLAVVSDLDRCEAGWRWLEDERLFLMKAQHPTETVTLKIASF